MIALNSVAELAEVERQELAVVYHHSPICWICALARFRLKRFARAHRNIPIYLVNVLRSRALVDEIAVRYQIPHASPQAIVLRRGVAVWDASHFAISGHALARSVGLQ